MKKFTKKLSVLLACVMAACILGGCGSSFDASAYVKALLDNSYKNDSTDLVAQKIGTAEEAAALYEEGIDLEIEALTEGVTLSDELLAEYRDTMGNIFAAVKYTVGDAEKQSDGSYVVTIEYQQMQIFDAAMGLYEEAFTAWYEEVENDIAAGGDVPSDDEMYEQIYAIMKDCLDEALTTVTYGDTQTLTIRVEVVDNVYTPNETDLTNLECSLLDIYE